MDCNDTLDLTQLEVINQPEEVLHLVLVNGILKLASGLGGTDYSYDDTEIVNGLNAVIMAMGNRPEGTVGSLWDSIAKIATNNANATVAITNINETLGTRPEGLTGSVWDNIRSNEGATVVFDQNPQW